VSHDIIYLIVINSDSNLILVIYKILVSNSNLSTYILYKRQKIFATDCVIYAFLNRPSDCDEIWYRDRLDLGGEDRLLFCREKR